MQFRQSLSDFPLTVALGEKSPSWGLSRWGGSSPLRFLPVDDDEGFTLRGDTRRLTYKGRRRSHRFTILQDGAFEYDVILNKEPESNVVVLPMEGAEQFDFFRQPDFIKDSYLAGSYAVYKKETLLGEGTGKLCHIHRPEIIDARGRRCWGELSIAGNCLCITIPEQWLADAKYPVVVDPTIGTTSVGSQTTGVDPNNPDFDRPWLDNEYALNKLYVPQNGRGLCTAFVYTYYNLNEYVIPCVYTDVNNRPYKKKSKMEKDINVTVFGTYYAPGWRSGIFMLDGDMGAGEYLWFGVFGSWFTTRYDYGGQCYKGWFDYDTYPDDEGGLTPYINTENWATYCDIKWSWYFTYSAIAAQNHVRKIFQGVTLTCGNEVSGVYKRTAVQKAQLVDRTYNSFNFMRSLIEMMIPLQKLDKKRDLFRKLDLLVHGSAGAKSISHFCRKSSETVKTAGMVRRGLLLFVRVITRLCARDYILWRFLKAREELNVKSRICLEITLDSRII